jgi:hypothetical protein
MAKKTVCDVCEGVILDGNNAGKRGVTFTHGDSVHLPVLSVSISSVKIEGITDPDVCIPCLKKAVAQA